MAQIIVTDQNRADLLPGFVKSKVTVIPNVPSRIRSVERKSQSGPVTLCYFGTLLRNRGSEFVSKLLAAEPSLRVLAAGWVRDAYTRSLLEHPRVEFLGVLPQNQINRVLAEQGDYLVAIYPTNNVNNVYASPNKLFDSVQTRTPIIINREVVVSRVVEEWEIGLVVDLTEPIDYSANADELVRRRGTFKFEDSLIDKYCWERFEEEFLALYR